MNLCLRFHIRENILRYDVRWGTIFTKAALGMGLPEGYPDDACKNFVVVLSDFAVIAADWLDNGLLAEPIKSP